LKSNSQVIFRNRWERASNLDSSTIAFSFSNTSPISILAAFLWESRSFYIFERYWITSCWLHFDFSSPLK